MKQCHNFMNSSSKWFAAINAILIGLVTSAVAADEFTESFTGGHYNQASLGVVGNSKCLIPEDSGLRIDISPPDTENSGLKLPQQLIGDFLITASVSMLEVPKPASGYGTGISILLEDGSEHGASFQRVRMPDDKQVYVTHNYIVTDGKYDHKAATTDAAGATTVLQMERKDASLIYRVSEDGGKSFAELHRVKFTSRPILVTEVYGQTGGAANPLSVRLESLTVKADELLRPGQKSKIQDRGKLPIIVAISLAVSATVALLVWTRLRRKGNRSSDT